MYYRGFSRADSSFSVAYVIYSKKKIKNKISASLQEVRASLRWHCNRHFFFRIFLTRISAQQKGRRLRHNFRMSYISNIQVSRDTTIHRHECYSKTKQNKKKLNIMDAYFTVKQYRFQMGFRN